MNDAQTMKAKEELSRIWKSINGSTTVVLKRGTRLWHCGRIERSEQIDDAKGLWATRNAARSDEYKGFACGQHGANDSAPTKLVLEISHDLKAADFSKQSLLEFAMNFCNADHNKLKEVIRLWLVDSELQAIVAANADPDEVMLARPGKDAVVVEAYPL